MKYTISIFGQIPAGASPPRLPMRKVLLSIIALSVCAFGQVRWSATTGDVSLSGAGMTATIQQPATGASNVQFEQVIVYCSVACTVSQAANGAAATATSGTITPILPSSLSATVTATFWTASNVGTGTPQGGIYHMTGAGTAAFCLNTSCGATKTVSLPVGGSTVNYSITISSITGTANITIYGDSY